MSDALDRLHDQLRRTFEAEPRRRAWRRHGLALTLAVGVSASGVAVAATQIVGSGQSSETQGRKIAFQALQDTATSPACRPADRFGTASTALVLPALRRALPLLGTPAAPVSALEELRKSTSRVIPSSVHVLDAGGGVRLTVFVEDGGTFRTADPGACLESRRQRADALLADRTAAVRTWAERRLAELVDTAPEVQILQIHTSRRGRPGSGGVGLPISPTRPLPRGLVGSGVGTYTGIAAPRASGVELDPARGARKEVAVVGGLWAATLPRGTGRVVVRERDETGRIVARYSLRD